MDHVAIMRKSWGMTAKILSGEKTVESRWYKNKSAPWGKIRAGDTVYFKNAGDPVSVRVRVRKIQAYENLDPEKVKAILIKYGEEDGITPDKIHFYYELFKNKKYCLLIFLENPKQIVPFEISKKGFGAMAAWMCVEDVNKPRV